MRKSAIVKYLILLLFMGPALLFAQYEKEDEEFKEYLESRVDLEELRSNPFMEYQKSDSLIRSISVNSDSIFNARFYNLLGKLNAEKGNLNVALEYYNTAAEYFDLRNPSPFFIHNYLDRGNIHYKNKNIERALEDYDRAVALASELDDQRALSTSYNNQGLLALRTGDMNLAKEKFQLAFTIRKQLGDSFLLAHSLGNLAMYNFHTGHYLDAIDFYKEAIQLLTGSAESASEKTTHEIARMYNDLGYAYYKEGKLNMAQTSANRSLQIAKKLSAEKKRVSLMYQSARVLYYSDHVDESIKLANEIRIISRDQDYKDNLLKAYQLLTDCYEKLSEYDKAMDYARLSQETKERLNKDQMDRKLADERFSYRAMNNKKLLKMIEKENQLKSTKLESQERINQLLFLVIFISLLGIVGLFYSNYQKNQVNSKLKGTNQLIETQNAEIRKQQLELKTAKAELEDKIMELENLTGEKTHLLSIVAHDLRTPLNSILGLVELIEMEDKDGELNPEEEKQYLELIKESGTRMLGMITTLLNVRKIESQNIEVNFSDVNVMKTINKILADFKNWAKRKNIEIKVENIEVIQSVYADENLFRQVLENLISNAIKYSPFKGEIIISGELDVDNRYSIYVRDNGPGISQEDQKHLFKKYMRLSARPTAGEDSVGIGLSLVKKLVELMEGKVSFQSQLGSGSTFSVEFAVSRNSKA